MLEPLSDRFSATSVRGRLLYYPEDPFLLRGLFLDSSSYDRDVVKALPIIQPYYVPYETLVFSYADAVGAPREEYFDVGPGSEAVTAISRYFGDLVVPWLRRVDTPALFASVLQDDELGDDLPFLYEAIAYSRLLSDDILGAEQWLQEVVHIARVAPTEDWARPSLERATAMLGLDPGQRGAQVRAWAAAGRASILNDAG